MLFRSRRLARLQELSGCALVVSDRVDVAMAVGARGVQLTSQGRKRDRVLGSASLAVAGALRRHLANDLEAQPREVCLTVLGALSGSAATVLPVITRLEGEYGHRGPVVAVPARLGRGRLQSVVEVPLDPVERVAFDNAAERSVAGTQRRGSRAV